LTCSVVAANDAPSLSRSSTMSSGRVLDGKNCCGTSLIVASAATSPAIVAPITHQRRSSAALMRPRSLR
jgi:hypothetical protein